MGFRKRDLCRKDTMKISHESPISMLKASHEYNDYDYALVHLFETEPEYLKFYKDSVSQGRHVLLDNSIFELGKAFDPDRFAYWIEELRPTEYVIPDVLEDTTGTLDSAEYFVGKYNYLPGKKIGVVQGKTYEQIIQCYKFLDKKIKVDKIAFSFDYSYYLQTNNHPNKWMAYVLGRIELLTRLLNEGLINKDKPHHLLGCALPIEFMFYREGFEWIETIDTSSPIVHGLRGIRYDHCGLLSKESVKLVELLHAQPTFDQMKDIGHNINIFRSFVRGAV